MIKVEIEYLIKRQNDVFIVKNPKKIEEWKERAKHCGMLCKIHIEELQQRIRSQKDEE